jgi:hypothetical protein
MSSHKTTSPHRLQTWTDPLAQRQMSVFPHTTAFRRLTRRPLPPHRVPLPVLMLLPIGVGDEDDRVGAVQLCRGQREVAAHDRFARAD